MFRVDSRVGKGCVLAFMAGDAEGIRITPYYETAGIARRVMDDLAQLLVSGAKQVEIAQDVVFDYSKEAEGF